MAGSKNQHVRKDNGSRTEREEGSHRVGATLTESILIDNAVVSSTGTRGIRSPQVRFPLADRFERPGCTHELAAVDGGVADVLALDEVDDVLGDVGGVVADALEIFGDEDQFERGKDDAGIAHHVSKQFTENLIAVVVHPIVGGEDGLRELDVAADDGVEGVANHLLGELAHARQIDVGLHARVAKDAQSSLRDVDGLIADALEIVVDARDRQDEAEIGGHELVQGEKLNDAVVDFHLKLVDGVFFLEDALGELFIGFQNRVNGLVNGALREAAHPEQALFQLVQVFFEVAFHGSFLSVPSAAKT